MTGTGGQLGFDLVRSLSPLGDIHGLDRASLNLCDASAIRDCVRSLRPSLIVNAAAYTAVDEAESDVLTCDAVNAVAPGILAEEAGRCGAAIVHFSTDYVFDGTSALPYCEDDPTGPLNVYGRTKRDGEHAVVAVGAPYMIFRASWIYSLRGRNFLRTMRRLFQVREEVSVVSDQRGSPSWSGVIAAATAAIVASASVPGVSLATGIGQHAGVYHLSAEDGASWYEFATAIRDLDPDRGSHRVRTIRPITSDEFPTRARRPRNSRLDAARAEVRFAIKLPAWREQLALCLADVQTTAR
ncbi:MAG: dTDP-4-dehydrorhamnose reductase [bacterium]